MRRSSTKSSNVLISVEDLGFVIIGAPTIKRDANPIPYFPNFS